MTEAQSPDVLPAGTVLDGAYRLTRPLGQGAMGTVYEGHHTVAGKRVALTRNRACFAYPHRDLGALFRERKRRRSTIPVAGAPAPALSNQWASVSESVCKNATSAASSAGLRWRLPTSTVFRFCGTSGAGQQRAASARRSGSSREHRGSTSRVL